MPNRLQIIAAQNRAVDYIFVFSLVAVLYPRSGLSEQIPKEAQAQTTLSSRVDSLPRSISVKEGRDLRFRRLARSSGTKTAFP